MKRPLTRIAQNAAKLMIGLALTANAQAAMVLNPTWPIQLRDTRYSDDLIRLLRPQPMADLVLANAAVVAGHR
jgi:hypothetical protein